MKLFNRLGIVAALTLGLVTIAHASIVAYTATATSGGQNYDAVFGMDFNVVGPKSVQVTDLGVFDNNNDNILNTDSGGTQPIVIQLWDRTTGLALASANFGAGTGFGSKVGFSFFKPVSVVLPPGQYYVSEDYSSSELFINGGNFPALDTGGGLISFVGSGRASFGHNYIFPNGGGGFLDGGPANRYTGPTFAFTAAAVPEPSTLAMALLGGLAIFGCINHHRRA